MLQSVISYGVVTILSVYIVLIVIIYAVSAGKRYGDSSIELFELHFKVYFFFLSSLFCYGYFLGGSYSDAGAFCFVGVIYLISEYFFVKIAIWFVNLPIWRKLQIYYDYIRDRQQL